MIDQYALFFRSDPASDSARPGLIVVPLAGPAGLPAGIRPWTLQFVWTGWPAVADCQPRWGHYDPVMRADPREAYAWRVVSVTTR